MISKEDQALKIIIKSLDERIKLITDTLNNVHTIFKNQNKVIENLALEVQIMKNKIQELEDRDNKPDKPSWR